MVARCLRIGVHVGGLCLSERGFNPGFSEEEEEIGDVLTEPQAATLKALLNRLIPADDYPNAWEAGVGDYLFRQWAGDLSALLPVYRDGLDGLEAEAVARQGKGFVHLAETEQDALLRQVEAGEVLADWTTSPVRFFQMAVHHTAEGYYSDPGNGGNRNGRAWEMVGFQIRESGSPR